mmetsp:Transcript_31511/g.77223  ORF Transcript_31511/g.77223 Transcript_31511/m.77223 type:complete len:420 (+) Transcript_31511:1057-2316(+)
MLLPCSRTPHLEEHLRLQVEQRVPHYLHVQDGHILDLIRRDDVFQLPRRRSMCGSIMRTVVMWVMLVQLYSQGVDFFIQMARLKHLGSKDMSHLLVVMLHGELHVEQVTIWGRKLPHTNRHPVLQVLVVLGHRPALHNWPACLCSSSAVHGLLLGHALEHQDVAVANPCLLERLVHLGLLDPLICDLLPHRQSFRSRQIDLFLDHLYQITHQGCDGQQDASHVLEALVLDVEFLHSDQGILALVDRLLFWRRREHLEVQTECRARLLDVLQAAVIVFRLQRSVDPDRVVLAHRKGPQALLRHRSALDLADDLLEVGDRVLLHHANHHDLVPIYEAAVAVLAEHLIVDEPDVHLVRGLQLLPLFLLEPLPQVLRDVLLRERHQHLRNLTRAHVHEHVCIRKLLVRRRVLARTVHVEGSLV